MVKDILSLSTKILKKNSFKIYAMCPNSTYVGITVQDGAFILVHA